MSPIYSCKSTIDGEGRNAWRITKFVDGEVESSYLTDGHQCDCPAGVRPSCRHRKMLPVMIAEDIVNTAFFLDYDGSGQVVDFYGEPVPRWMREGEPEGDGREEQDEPAPSELALAPKADEVAPIPTLEPSVELPDEAYLDCDDQTPPVALAGTHPWRRL